MRWSVSCGNPFNILRRAGAATGLSVGARRSRSALMPASNASSNSTVLGSKTHVCFMVKRDFKG